MALFTHRAVAPTGMALATGLILAMAIATSASAVTYCQAVCKDRASAACLERCNGNDQQRSKTKKYTPPPVEVVPDTPVAKDVKQPDWTITVFDPKGGGGNGGGGGGGNGR